MSILKTFLVSAGLAVSTLGFVALSTPAHACVSCAGIKFNGIDLNGISWNGVRLNGVRLNGLQFNGAQRTGTGNEPATTRVLAVTLPG